MTLIVTRINHWSNWASLNYCKWKCHHFVPRNRIKKKLCDYIHIKRNVLKAYSLEPFRAPTMSMDWPVGAVLCDNTQTLLVLNSIWYVRTFSENLSLSQVVWEMLERVNATTGVLQPGTFHYPTVQQTRLLSDKLVARMADREGEEKNGGKEEWQRN